MNQLESFLQTPLPLIEAASFLVRLKGEKTASVQEILEGLEDLEPSERAEIVKAASALPLLVTAGHVKKATDGSPAVATATPPPLGPGASGKNMAAPTPMSLPSTAMGVNKVAAAKATPESVGADRGRANAAAHFERESHRHGERTGTTLGRMAGLAAGAAGAHHVGKGNTLASIAGAALGQHVGAALGRSAGKASDERSFHSKHAAAVEKFHPGTLHYHGDAIQTALLHGSTRGTVIVPDLDKYASVFKEALEGAGIVPQVAPEMSEFLATEQQADGEAAKQQLEFLRGKFQEAVAAQQAAEERAQQLEATQATTDQTLANYQAQVADATQKAMGAQDEVLSNQQAAAAMRMAYQQLRGTLLQAASTDPPMLSGNEAALAAASTAAGPSNAPAGQTGPAGQSPNPGTPNTVAPEGGDQVSQPVQPNEPLFGNASPTTAATQKEPADGTSGRSPGKEVLSSALPFVEAEKLAALRDFLSHAASEGMKGLKAVGPHAAVGGALGAGLGFAESQMSNEPLRQKVQELEAKGDQRTTGDAMNLALSRGRLTLGEHAEKHPVAATMASGLAGATLGARGGPAFVDALKSLKGLGERAVGDIKTIAQK